MLFIVESVYKSLEVFLDGAIYRGKCLQVFRSPGSAIYRGKCYKSLEVFLDGAIYFYKSSEVFLDCAIYRGKCLQVFRSVSGWCYLSWKVFTSL